MSLVRKYEKPGPPLGKKHQDVEALARLTARVAGLHDHLQQLRIIISPGVRLDLLRRRRVEAEAILAELRSLEAQAYERCPVREPRPAPVLTREQRKVIERTKPANLPRAEPATSYRQAT
jgi:hypothetical protein